MDIINPAWAAPLGASPNPTHQGCSPWSTTPGGMTIADDPETEPLTFVLFNESVNEPVGTIEINGRAGLNSWYLTHVGKEPDEEPGGLVLDQVGEQIKSEYGLNDNPPFPFVEEACRIKKYELFGEDVDVALIIERTCAAYLERVKNFFV